MTNPEFHGEQINPETNPLIAARLSQLASDLEGSEAACLAAQLVPVVPDGGIVGQKITPHVKKATSIRDSLRIWAPGLIATLVFLTVIAVFPVPGPLLVYGLAIVGFGWWHAAGRPGPIESIRMLTNTIRDAGTRIRAAVTCLAVRRSDHEARRTSTQGGGA
ncbi:hypothetical protein JK358_34295 [Nocardia sp. 2]|uniref:Uncharacterized protein n=1 Tax=Nocardia acididurans TaxID=2802282 RepID=A0ABS1MGU7_9NOCA|nr:hypothetical protein [Nocardia acididurans]MBL1079489.1 hypothetical protein [Nocardia acididurans]